MGKRGGGGERERIREARTESWAPDGKEAEGWMEIAEGTKQIKGLLVGGGGGGGRRSRVKLIWE